MSDARTPPPQPNTNNSDEVDPCEKGVHITKGGGTTCLDCGKAMTDIPDKPKTPDNAEVSSVKTSGTNTPALSENRDTTIIPQADNLREAIVRIIGLGRFKNEVANRPKSLQDIGDYETADEILTLFKDREQQLLTEILGEAETLSEIVTVDKTSGFRPIEAVPVAVIKQRMVGTGSSQDADNAQGGRT